MLTVDTPRLGRRERDIRNGFTLPADISIRNLERYARDNTTRWPSDWTFTEYVHKLLDASLSWDSVSWLRSITTLPILIKGILTAEDARLAFDHGASGIVVSNHGGRQLDGAIATLDALPEIAAAVSDRMPILLDGGVRRGTDVVKAIALGAAAVLVGRPYLWALAADGEAGVTAMLSMLRAEVELAMALAGCPTIPEIGPALVVRRA